MFYHLSILANSPAAEATDSGIAGTVKEIATNFKILPELFIPQVISFLLVAVLLKKFAFGPIQAMLEQRKQRIADGESKLKQIEQQLADSAKHTEEVIGKANADAKRLIEEAKSSATALSEAKAQEAVATAQGIIAKAEAAAKAERAQIAADLKREFGRLVANTAQNATGGKLTADQQRAINEESLARVEA
jgi:F-type H+-transporting ATPase subunit b